VTSPNGDDVTTKSSSSSTKVKGSKLFTTFSSKESGAYTVDCSSASASASSSATSKALTDDNKAGKPRPTSSYSSVSSGATIHEDGSWDYTSSLGTMHVQKDGTWTWESNNGDKANLNADGTWEKYEAARDERVHVNPDGSWIRVRESGDTDLIKGAQGMEVKADGSWRSVDSHSTLYGTADGKVYQEKPGQEKREVGKELTPSVVPVPPTLYAPGGVGGNSVVPLKPRTPLKAGEKAQ
ncbi:MAG: hypothetical protein ACFNLH_09730, partial [Corynebacterium matruchotii]